MPSAVNSLLMDDYREIPTSLLSCASPVAEAYALAHARHAGQVRKDGASVIEHVIAVAELALELDGCDAQLLAAALLHDSIEKRVATLDEIRSRFGPRVAALVEALTMPDGETYAEAAQRAFEAGPDALLLRLCDRLDGLRRVGSRPPATRESYLETTRSVHLPLAERWFPEIAQRLTEALDAAQTSEAL